MEASADARFLILPEVEETHVGPIVWSPSLPSPAGGRGGRPHALGGASPMPAAFSRAFTRLANSGRRK